MRRWAQILTALVLAVVGVAEMSHAQPAPDKGYVEVAGGATFGHKKGGSVAVEGGYWLTDLFGVFAEAGRLTNVATSEIDSKAHIVANALGLGVSVKQPVNFFDIGVVGRFPLDRLTPFVQIGIGRANVSNDVTFSGPLSSQVQLGGDLSDTYGKVFVTFGLGARYEIHGPWFADLSYRYGHIGPNSDTEVGSISTSRLQVGGGIRF